MLNRAKKKSSRTIFSLSTLSHEYSISSEQEETENEISTENILNSQSMPDLIKINYDSRDVTDSDPENFELRENNLMEIDSSTRTRKDGFTMMCTRSEGDMDTVDSILFDNGTKDICFGNTTFDEENRNIGDIIPSATGFEVLLPEEIRGDRIGMALSFPNKKPIGMELSSITIHLPVFEGFMQYHQNELYPIDSASSFSDASANPSLDSMPYLAI